MRIYCIPWDKGGFERTIGCAKGPAAILDALKDVYVGDSGKPLLIEPVQVPIDPSDWNKSAKAMHQAVASHQGLAISLGGDHSVTHHLITGLLAREPGAGLLMLDAHADCLDGTSLPTHEDFIPQLVRQGGLPAERIILFGLRNIHPQEQAFLNEHKIDCYGMRRILDLGFDEAVSAVMQKARQWSALYVSVDIDVADPSCAPGTGYLEPGGLSAQELIHTCRRISRLQNLRAIDVVEVNPARDSNGMTAALGARVIRAFL
ncbi:hypothetical protein AUJ68_04580 [Candidatus Woesearchaeota archaeon CG1_02_57_44]|nr:MAG: hypothetical protein AUJ68_04580 [Candidatus Woesearchaeota archaeon CG1_02_57_44]